VKSPCGIAGCSPTSPMRYRYSGPRPRCFARSDSRCWRHEPKKALVKRLKVLVSHTEHAGAQRIHSDKLERIQEVTTWVPVPQQKKGERQEAQGYAAHTNPQLQTMCKANAG